MEMCLPCGACSAYGTCRVTLRRASFRLLLPVKLVVLVSVQTTPRISPALDPPAAWAGGDAHPETKSFRV